VDKPQAVLDDPQGIGRRNMGRRCAGVKSAVSAQPHSRLHGQGQKGTRRGFSVAMAGIADPFRRNVLCRFAS
jgi:hypothetical protein